MAYERGEGTVEVELSRTQSWIEFADKDLYGRNGDKGVIQEHRDDRAERKALFAYVRWMVGLIAALGGVPGILLLLSVLHVIRIP